MPNYDRDEGRSRRHRSRSRSWHREYESARRRSASPLGRRDNTERHTSRTDRQQRNRSRSRSTERATTTSKRRGDDSYSKSTRRNRGRSRSRERRSSRSRSRSWDKHRRHSRSASTSSGRSTGSERERERRRRKEKKRERKEKKERKKEKRKLKGASGADWGKYGVLTETDIYNKDPEFRTWLIEEKMVNHELLSKDMTKKYFKEFAEDYNTATLPHEKYYDMESYERKMDRIKSGALALEDIKGYDPLQDIQSHTKSMKRTPAEKESYLSKAQVEELRDIQRQRQQIGKMKLLGMNIDSKHGVRMEEGME